MNEPMTKTVDAVLFDIDGTLVHTPFSYMHAVVLETLLSINAPEDLRNISERQIKRFWYEGDRDTFIATHFSVEPELFWSAFQTFDSQEKRASVISVYDDVSFLLMLRAHGYKLGAVTNAPERIAQTTLSKVGRDLFDTCVFGDNGFTPKPHPAGIQECLRRLAVDPTRALFIGNAAEDVLAAQHAKVSDVIIDRGEYLWNGVQPTRRIQSLYDLSAELIRE